MNQQVTLYSEKPLEAKRMSAVEYNHENAQPNYESDANHVQMKHEKRKAAEGRAARHRDRSERNQRHYQQLMDPVAPSNDPGQDQRSKNLLPDIVPNSEGYQKRNPNSNGRHGLLPPTPLKSNRSKPARAPQVSIENEDSSRLGLKRDQYQPRR